MMLIAWTTVAERADADRLAAEAVRLGLAACVQVEGPLTSHYRWQGRTEASAEHRLTFKLLAGRLAELEAWVLAHHPYETPEWIVVRAERVSEKYLSWAASNPDNRTL